jgi:membrane-bound lytic murein transglycosylase A
MTLLLVGCTTTTITENPRSVSVTEIDSLKIESGPDQEPLRRALGHSIKYYERLPVDQRFQYGNLEYSPEEMIASHQYFMEILNLSEDERTKKIRQDFHWFESFNDKNQAFFTGYYEPLLKGGLSESKEFPVPLYGVPKDLVTINLSNFDEKYGKGIVRGKVVDQKFVQYDDRNQISYQDSLQGRAIPLAWVKNEIELFFLQIQGSGVIELPNGKLYRVNYADQNGHPYRAIGKILLGEIPREKMSLKALKEYLYVHSDRVQEILNYNPSYTFFRHIIGDGPLGNIEVPLTAQHSIAMDYRLVPRGGLVFYQTNLPSEVSPAEETLHRFAVVQDTGGAIRGHGRADIFWGRGKLAEKMAGPMKENGRIFLLVARKEVLLVKNGDLTTVTER